MTFRSGHYRPAQRKSYTDRIYSRRFLGEDEPVEFDLLVYLMTHPGEVFSREQLLERVWKYEWFGDSSTVTVHIRRLRTKVEAEPDNPKHIKTVWGSGYRWEN